MASIPYRGGAAPYKSREGLITRPAASSDEIQLRIDPMHADLDDEVTGLYSQVRQLRNVAQEIESEAKFQNDAISQLQMMLIKAQAGVKNNMRKLNKSIIQQGSSHVMHVVLLLYFCFSWSTCCPNFHEDEEQQLCCTTPALLCKIFLNEGQWGSGMKTTP